MASKSLRRVPERWEPIWREVDYIVKEPERNEHNNPSAFDIVSKLLLPVALGISAYFGRAHAYLLILFVALALVVTFFHSLRRFTISIWDRAHDKRVVSDNLRQLQQLSKEAGEYFNVSTSRSDSLPGIMQELGVRNHAAANAIHLPNLGIFQEHWKFLNHRIQNEHLNPSDFHNAANELTSLTQSYNSFYVYPLFHTYAAELREVLTASEKSKLNAFQQKYASFLDTYSKYITRVGEEFRTLPELHAGMPSPNPL